ncbi:MAG TPA: BA14K family protein [Methyloceanibacter sp.]|nr:BA14K family protein [Methyloceanibacter sp.]
MTKSLLKSVAVAALLGTAVASLPAPAEAGNAVGAGLIGFGVGAIVGSALTPRTVYVAPPPPPPVYYGVGYGPPAWTPAWYSYCAARHPSFNAQTGYFYTYSGRAAFCY